jgi:predicted dehydrogenase
MDRRQFLHTSTLATAALAARPFITPLRPAKLKTALIGSGWWGTNILREGIRTGAIQVVALCDVDQNQLKKCSAEVNKLCNDQPKIYTDYRECIAKEKPDIVINATPDHWHALIAIEALKNGAHVFLEKPISHTVKEGTAIEKAARDAQRICIVDFHRRYSPHNVSGQAFLKSGKVGVIKEVKAFVNYSWGMGKMEDLVAPPEGLDWNAYCGPAPIVPYNSNIHPRAWRQYMALANGQIGDWGPHWFDQILWWTEEKMPKKIYSIQKKGVRQTRADSPEHQIAVYEFEQFTCTWEHSMLYGHPERKTEGVGVYFHGTKGVFHMGWQQGWTFFPADSKKEIIKEAAQMDKPDDQNIALVWKDFLKSIETKQLPFADIERGRHATNMALLGNVAATVGRSIEWDWKKDQIVNDKKANALLKRDYRKGYEYPK